jgi:hypothetical protein
MVCPSSTTKCTAPATSPFATAASTSDFALDSDECTFSFGLPPVEPFRESSERAVVAFGCEDFAREDSE